MLVCFRALFDGHIYCYLDAAILLSAWPDVFSTLRVLAAHALL